MSTLFEHLFQGFCLSDGARESVEDDAFACWLSVVGLGKNLYHKVVGDKLTVGDISLGYLAQFCSVLDFGTQHVARADVPHAIPVYNLVAVGALA